MLTVHLLTQHASEVPDRDGWLSASEQEVLARYRAPKRRRDWRLGRWTGKAALLGAGVFGEGTAWDDRVRARITIRANEAGAPCVLVDDKSSGWVVSLTHTGEHGLAAAGQQPASIGCDMEVIGRRGEEFVLDYFTGSERALVDTFGGDDRSTVVTLIWSAKESAVKALGVGLRLDTRDVHVGPVVGHPPFSAWSALVVQTPGRRFEGWWRTSQERVLTMVSDPAPGVPIDLNRP
jgi:4'-phosphopantetheinyl transferase